MPPAADNLRILVVQSDPSPEVASRNSAICAASVDVGYVCSMGGSGSGAGGLGRLLRAEVRRAEAEWALCLAPDTILKERAIAACRGLLRKDRNEGRLLVFAAGELRGQPFPSSDASDRVFLMSLRHPASNGFAALIGATAELAKAADREMSVITRCVHHQESARTPSEWFNRYWASDPFAMDVAEDSAVAVPAVVVVQPQQNRAASARPIM